MGPRHHPHPALAGLLAQAEVQAQRSPAWRPSVPPLQRRAMWITTASTSMALAAGAALMWDGASDAIPSVVQASQSVSLPVRATPAPQRPFATVVPSTESELPRHDEAPPIRAQGTATHPPASEPLPPGIVPDDMPSSP